MRRPNVVEEPVEGKVLRRVGQSFEVGAKGISDMAFVQKSFPFFFQQGMSGLGEREVRGVTYVRLPHAGGSLRLEEVGSEGTKTTENLQFECVHEKKVQSFVWQRYEGAGAKVGPLLSVVGGAPNGMLRVSSGCGSCS